VLARPFGWRLLSAFLRAPSVTCAHLLLRHALHLHLLLLELL
jgi:hypothetical protein